MSTTTYNTITLVLSIGLLLAFLTAMYSLVALFVRWRTPQRRRHVIGLAWALAAGAGCVAMQQAVLWLVFLPALGRAQRAEYDAARAAKILDTSRVQTGDPLPPFSVSTLDGDHLSLPSYGDVVLINFFATWCGPCLQELPHLDRIWSDNRTRDHFRLVMIGREETRDSLREFRRQHGSSCPLAPDPDREIYALFAAELIPRTLIVSPEGRIVYSKAGFDENDLDELNAVLEAQFAGLQ